MKIKKDIPSWIPYVFLAISFFGFVDATYLTVKHLQNEAPACSVLEGCDQVTGSQYAELFGIPVALLGAIYYAVIFFLSIAYIDRKQEQILRILSLTTTVGFLASAWFVYAQLVLLDAICLYCMGSALSSTLLFLFGTWTLAVLQRGKGLFK